MTIFRKQRTGLNTKLVKMVGFRDIIAHDYEKLDYEIVCNILQKGDKDIKNFLTRIEEKLKLK